MEEKRTSKDIEKSRRTVRRSSDFKSQLSEASSLLAAKMEEKRRSWDSK
ncbi:hypothetical protein [Pantoea rodasii]|nr:hypothetical protein [Pantoea rodasii]